MAEFEIALIRTLRHEGGYANNPTDSGGETYRGLARNFHPAWAGWPIIDAAKTKPGFPRSLEANPLVQSLVADFYRVEYWDRIRAAEICSQVIANELFDASVNHGLTPAVKLLQQAMYYLTSPPFEILTIDGVIGPVTLSAVNRWLTNSAIAHKVAANSLLSMMIVLRAVLYVRIVYDKPGQRVFFEGWIRRILGSPEITETSESRGPSL
jgi:lysozyme family protein